MTTSTPGILDDVNAALQADTRLDITDLVIREDAEDGPLIVEGRVPDIASKRQAMDTVWRVVGQRRPLDDRLRVETADAGEQELRASLTASIGEEPMFAGFTITIGPRAASGDRRDDEPEMVHDGGTQAPRIDLRVGDGVVVLEGAVPSLSHRRFAEVLAWWAPGCERVDNVLTVHPPERDSDNELTDVVRMVLEKDPLVTATQLRPGTAGGMVELQGLVASDEERRLAVRDAWYVPGVWSVRDNIEVSQPNR